MGIGKYIKEIGRGKQGARSLERAQACDLFGQVLDGSVSDLEIGAFCVAMRIKGEAPEETAGFLDATCTRMQQLPASAGPLVVIPSYNGARRLPLLTPLLGLLLARAGASVLIHGTSTESTRVATIDVLAALDITPRTTLEQVAPASLAFVPTALLCPGLQRLLEVRRVVGLRNPAHSLVKLMNPCAGPSLLVSSYTHPEYAASMAATFMLTGTNALLLRGTEGEAVADPRRIPSMQAFVGGQARQLEPPQTGPLAALPALPPQCDVASSSAYIQAVLRGEQAVPAPIALQVAHILQLLTLL